MFDVLSGERLMDYYKMFTRIFKKYRNEFIVTSSIVSDWASVYNDVDECIAFWSGVPDECFIGSLMTLNLDEYDELRDAYEKLDSSEIDFDGFIDRVFVATVNDLDEDTIKDFKETFNEKMNEYFR